MRLPPLPLLLLMLTAGPLLAQPRASATDTSLARFLAEARQGTVRYRSQEEATADGFRRVGVDFPAMGEHWVSPQRVLSDSFAAHHPAMLTYIRVDGIPRLAGVVYATLLRPGEHPPRFVPADGLWHEHNGSVVEESLPSHHGPESFTGAFAVSPQVRVSVLHAWIWDENSAGVFATENWSLPFHRLGVPPRPGVTRAAVHALALATDGEEYYVLTIRTALSSSSTTEDEAIRRILAARRSQAREIAVAAREHGLVEDAVVVRLETLWAEMWEELIGELPGHSERLRELREHL